MIVAAIICFTVAVIAVEFRMERFASIVKAGGKTLNLKAQSAAPINIYSLFSPISLHSGQGWGQRTICC